MEIRGRRLLLLPLVFLLISAEQPAGATSLVTLEAPLVELALCDAVFSGSILSRVPEGTGFEDASRTRDTFLVAVGKIWKGILGDTIQVHSEREGLVLGYPFEVGRSYLIYATVSEQLDASPDSEWSTSCGRGATGDLSCRIHSRTKALSSADRDVGALDSLGVTGDPGLVDSAVVVTILDELFSLSEEERRVATNRLRRIGKRWDLMVPALEKAFRRGEREDQVLLLNWFGDNPRERALVDLIHLALDDEDPYVRAAAIAAGRWEGQLPTLLEGMRDESPFVRKRTVKIAEGHDRDDTVARELIRLMSDPDAEVRAAAVRSLSHPARYHPEALPELLRATEDSSSMVRASALYAVYQSGLDFGEIVPTLLRGARDRDIGVRITALDALGMLSGNQPPQEIVPVLRNALQDENPPIRVAAIHALGRFVPDEGAVSALLEAIARDSDSLRKGGVDSDATNDATVLSSKNLVSGRIYTVPKRPGEMQQVAFLALTKSDGYPEIALRASRIALLQSGPRLRLAAVRNLPRLVEHDRAAIELLRSCLDDPDAAVRRFARDGLEAAEESR